MKPGSRVSESHHLFKIGSQLGDIVDLVHIRKAVTGDEGIRKRTVHNEEQLVPQIDRIGPVAVAAAMVQKIDALRTALKPVAVTLEHAAPAYDILDRAELVIDVFKRAFRGCRNAPSGMVQPERKRLEACCSIGEVVQDFTSFFDFPHRIYAKKNDPVLKISIS